MSKNFSPNAVNQQTFGAAGFKHINNSLDHTGDFVAITVLEEATVGDYDNTGNGIITTTGDDLPNATKLPVGVTIYGDFTNITLDTTSGGRVIAYYRALG